MGHNLKHDKEGRPIYPEHAVCPRCKEITEWTDEDSDNDANLMAECDHCGCEFPLYYADFTDSDIDGHSQSS